MLTHGRDSQGFPRRIARCLAVAAAMAMMGFVRAGALALGFALAAAETGAASVEPRAEETAGALPQFISLRAPEANLRRGPGDEFRIDWVYRRRGLPLVLLDRFGNWRQVRDPDGATGWMHRNMLSSKRTVMVMGDLRALKDKPEAASRTLAFAEPGAIGDLERCEAGWCRVDFPGPGQAGWIEADALWGADLPSDLAALNPAPPAKREPAANPGN
jgi:SH3-like domain-containing protein